MRATQPVIDAVMTIYNELTHAHKRAPVEAYVQKQLSVGEVVELLSGYPRWSSALRFHGTPEDMKVTFVINEALPSRFIQRLEHTRTRFDQQIQALTR